MIVMVSGSEYMRLSVDVYKEKYHTFPKRLLIAYFNSSLSINPSLSRSH